ncbi:uncharacterized protein M6B38_246090 [Iris pallida]|uniref:Uncharacterized protein n=1 Tax=Iris pallida TaxID=29817 RepID=A0AAX6DGW1_IRIPA|nr:uncharacterized protein M6B38_246090 [Iris pallida]
MSWSSSSSFLQSSLPLSLYIHIYLTRRVFASHIKNHLIRMASAYILDVWGWINNLAPFSQWNTNSMSLCICVAKSTTQPSIHLSITGSPPGQNPYITFHISANLQVPITITLWTSNSFPLKSKSQQSLDEDTLLQLFYNIINGVLGYGPSKKSSFRLPAVRMREELRDVFNMAFLTLAFLVCIYEAPQDLRSECIDALRLQLTSSRSREASKMLVRVLGSNLEEQWMRSLNLAITNRMIELQTSNYLYRTPSPLFSYAVSATGLWKVQLFCPIIAMNLEDPSSTTQDERLLFSLNYQQLEGVIQLAYKVIYRANWIDVVVSVDNVRCDVNPLISENLMDERGYGSEEKHFPSRISLRLTPTGQSDVVSVTVSKSSDNPTHEVGLERTLEGSFDPPNSYLGLRMAASESVTMSMKPWKFEQSVHGDSTYLNWFLHDGANGREVFSSKPSKLSLFQPRAWFRDRYSSAYRPFTKQGGVVFAGDEYGESVWWKVCGRALGKTMEWEIKGWIWLTYWPNKQRTLHTETRRLEFRELLHLPLGKLD